MPCLNGRIGQQGPMIDVRVMLAPQRVEALKRAGRTYPPPRTVLGLVDTGAGCSAIDRILAASLQLEPRGVTRIHTPSTGDAYEERYVYDVAFVLGFGHPDPLYMTLSVIESSLASEGFWILVGRDLLARCRMTYDGPTDRFMLEWSP